MQSPPQTDLTVTHFFLLALAIFRLTRLFVYDGVMAWLRDLFLDVKIKNQAIVRTKYEYGLQRSVSDIFSCPWCFSMWGGSVFLWLYILEPTIMTYLAVLLALSGLATLLQLGTNLLGWKAEHQKIVTQREQ